MRIAYLTQCFPGNTVTFIRREIEEIVALSESVEVVSIRRPEGKSKETTKDFSACPVTYLEEKTIFNLFSSHLFYAFSKPTKYWPLLLDVLFRWKLMNQRLRWRLLKLFAISPWAARYFKKNQINHIHCFFTANASTLGFLVNKLEPINFSISAHNIFLTDTLLLHKKLSAACFVTVISDYAKNYLVTRYPDCADLAKKMIMVRCGVQKSYLRENEQIVKHAKGETIQILCVGQLVERKGQQILIEALGKMDLTSLSIQCHIVGEGPEEYRLKKLVSKLGLSNIVNFTGAISQTKVQSLLSQAFLFVLPCIRTTDGDEDGIPVALMEAMARHIPCISTPVAGIPELITSEVHGILVEEGNSNALATAITDSIRSPEILDSLSVAAYSKIQADYIVEDNVRHLINVIRKSQTGRGLLAGAATSTPFSISALAKMQHKMPSSAFIQWGGLGDSHRSEFLSESLNSTHIGLTGSGGLLNLLFPFQLISNLMRLISAVKRLSVDIIFIQQPPFYIAFIVAKLTQRNNVNIVLDCHSGVLLDHKWKWSWPIVKSMSQRFSGAIFTNGTMAEEAGELDCRKIILPDPPVEFKGMDNTPLATGKPTAMIICSSSSDEDESWIVKAAVTHPEILFYVTNGIKWPMLRRNYSRRLSDNVVPLEYMSDKDYYQLMNAVDFVICLTNREHTLLSGAFEALWLEKPILTSNSLALNDYFGDVVVYTNDNLEDISMAINTMLCELPMRKTIIKEFRLEAISRWIDDVEIMIKISEVKSASMQSKGKTLKTSQSKNA